LPVKTLLPLVPVEANNVPPPPLLPVVEGFNGDNGMPVELPPLTEDVTFAPPLSMLLMPPMLACSVPHPSMLLSLLSTEKLPF